jgi:hypothetical protein
MVIGPGIYVIAFQVRVVCGATSPIGPSHRLIRPEQTPKKTARMVPNTAAAVFS